MGSWVEILRTAIIYYTMGYDELGYCTINAVRVYGCCTDYEQELPASVVSRFSTATINPATHPWHPLVETKGAQLYAFIIGHDKTECLRGGGGREPEKRGVLGSGLAFTAFRQTGQCTIAHV